MSALSFAFPQPLAEKYRPHTIGDFIGLERPKKIMANFARNPRSAAFLFTGPSGTGKTTMALALCDAMKTVLVRPGRRGRPDDRQGSACIALKTR